MTAPAPTRPRVSRRRRGAFVALSVLVSGSVALLLPATTAGAAVAPLLGTADSFAVLGHETVTNTGFTVIDGNLGVSPGTAITGFESSTPAGPGRVLPPGATHSGPTSLAAQAGVDAEAAYGNLAGQPCPAGNNLTGQNLGGLSLVAGVYCFDIDAGLTGTLTLDGDADDVFVFQVRRALNTAAALSPELASRVQFSGGANACNVFWQVASSATLGTFTEFAGTIIARTSITAQTNANLTGRLLALDAAVTLDDNNVSVPTCAAAPALPGDSGGTAPGSDTTTGDTTPPTTVPSPTTPVGRATPAAGTTTGIAVPSTPVPSADVPSADVPSASAPPASAPPASAPPRSGAPRLPYTGLDSGGLALLGLALIGIGGSARHLSHRGYVPHHASQSAR